LRKASASSLQASQRVLLLIFKFLTEFRQMSWRRYDRFTGDMSVPQCYHWNHPEIHSHIGNVVSTTLEYGYKVELQFTRRRRSNIYSTARPVSSTQLATIFDTVDNLLMTSVKQYVT